MRQALYRKYRSRAFDEVVGQEHITKTLQMAIKNGRISHAYLFTGPRGVGKTSVARILAHEANQLPYNDESLHLDIIEIDAASNRRIDEIRDLRERVRIAPTSAKYKVYIIDEVHMLTREAFNALLKTLEEPPPHCIFILATTEAHKLPETIISRTQRFEFKPIGPSEVAKHLSGIAKREKIVIDADALELLADFGQGSFRDSIGYLDQLSSRTGKITAADVRGILGLPSQTEISKLLSGVQKGDLSQTLDSLRAIRIQGVDAAQIAAALAAEIRSSIASGRADKPVIQLLKQLLEVPASSRPYDYLEIIVLEAGQQYAANQAGPNHNPPTSGSGDRTEKKSEERKTKKNPAESQDSAGSAEGFDITRWEEVVSRAKNKAASIYTALRLAEPELEDGALILKFEFPLHQKKLEKAENKQLVASIIDEIFGVKMPVRCVVDKEAFSREAEEDRTSDEPDNGQLTSINNIFGGAEVLES